MRFFKTLALFLSCLPATAVAQSVRVIHGNVCGSGWFAGHDQDNSYVFTNAHVAGTQLGNTMQLDYLLDGVRQKTNGTLIVAAFSPTKLTDWAVLRTARIRIAAWPLSRDAPTAQRMQTCGSPRCVWPQTCSALTSVAFQSATQPWLWTPDAIGGQSGSAIRIADTAFGLLTWSWGGRGAGQQTSVIFTEAQKQEISSGTRPSGLREVADRHETAEGFFSETQAVTELPIWATLPPDTPSPDHPSKIDPIKLRKLLELIFLLLDLIASMRQN